jgi:preprotein translocase subunit SecA
VIYAIRRRILEGENLRERVLESITSQIGLVVAAHIPSDSREESDPAELVRAYKAIVPMSKIATADVQGRPPEDIEDLLVEDAEKYYDEKEQATGSEMMRVLERAVMLNVIDRLWREHLTQMDDMRQGISLQAYAQKDPLVAYKREGFRMFEQLLVNIDYDIAHRIYFASIERAPQPVQPRNLMTNHPEEGEATPKRRTEKKIGRNDPCWCGSGKKFKQCHGAPNAARAG